MTCNTARSNLRVGYNTLECTINQPARGPWYLTTQYDCSPRPIGAPADLQMTNTTSSASNLVCDLLLQLANRTVGSASSGPVAGDVVGYAVMDKLESFAVGTVSNNTEWWDLPANAAIPELVKPCSSLKNKFTDFTPSTHSPESQQGSTPAALLRPGIVPGLTGLGPVNPGPGGSAANTRRLLAGSPV